MSKNKSVNITMTDDLIERLKTAAEEREISFAAFVRLACTEYLKQCKK
jgi:predicted DNA-binding ribbon-helix-helix protein